MKNLLVAVSAYAGDQNQVEANLPVYQHHGAPVLILTPSDKPILELPTKPEGVYYHQGGEAQWAGPKSLDRHRYFLRHLLTLPYDWFLFHDADSICLRADLPSYLFDDPSIHWSNEVRDLNPGVSALPKLAMQPPYFFSKTVLEKLVSVLDRPAMSYYIPVAEENMPVPTDCIDHFELQLVYAAELPHRSFPDGASFETSSEHGLRTMHEHVEVLGKSMIHSVKTTSALLSLLGARYIYTQTHQ